MSYIGNSLTQQSFTGGMDQFNGNASNTTFGLSRSVTTPFDVEVYVESVFQRPGIGYDVSANTIVFSSAPSTGSNNVVVVYRNFTATSIVPAAGSVTPTAIAANTIQATLGYVPANKAGDTFTGATTFANTTHNGSATFANTVTVAASGITFNDTSAITTAPSGFGFKNRLINGAMRINQRQVANSSPIYDGVYPVDRWRAALYDSSWFNYTQLTGNAVPPGFTNAVQFTSTGNNTPPEYSFTTFQQKIEGNMIPDLAFGTANAKTLSLSFWTKSSLTGTFSGAIIGPAASRSYPFTYTITAANTWEYKTVVIPGYTSGGTWYTDIQAGLMLTFNLGTGSIGSGTANVWQSGSKLSATGTVNLSATSGASWAITGVQLEASPAATAFDWRPHTTELQLCQRYYCHSFADGVAPANAIPYQNNTMAGGMTTYGANNGYINQINFPVTMRDTPGFITFYSTSLPASPTAGMWSYYNGSTWTNLSGTNLQNSNQSYFSMQVVGTWSANSPILYMGAWAAYAEL